MSYPNRPNILFLISDQHRADVAGFAGDLVVRTPVLDELTRTGVVFRNAYTPSPQCVPARQCILAGQLPSTCGCEGWKDLPPGYMTWPRRLAQRGYKTVACGKVHHTGLDQMMGWCRRVGMDDMASPGEYIESTDAWQEWASYAPPGDDPEVGAIGKPRGLLRRAGVGRSPYTDWDEYALLGAQHFIEHTYCSTYLGRPNAAPTALYVGFNNPHDPYLTDEERFRYYLNRVQPYLDEPMHDHPVLGTQQGASRTIRVGSDGEISPHDIRRATAAYYGNIEANDDRWGRLLDALRHAGQDLDDWIIIYTSDHGEMLGQHGLWFKQRFFEASARVPLIIRWPRGFAGGRVVDANVSLCDLFATLCDLTGIDAPPDLDSRSLRPLLEGSADGWPDEVVSQWDTNNLMIKRGALKYQCYGSNGEVLFDLDADPEERRNVAPEPAYAEAMSTFRHSLRQIKPDLAEAAGIA